jgi:biopolymer transport protein ExbB/TolQ
MADANGTMRPAAQPAVMLTVGQKYTNVQMIPSLLVALAGGSVTYGLAFLLKDLVPYFYGLLIERGPIQYFTTYGFWFTMGLLIFKNKSLQKQRSAFGFDFIKSFAVGREAMGTKTFVGEMQVIEENLKPEQKDLILVSRINKAIKQIRINKNPADVANILSTVAETDNAIMDSSYVLIKYMIWALPILGFIGTVIGMTEAIGSFDAVLKSVNKEGFSALKENLGMVTGGLSVAFDTTFLALVLSAVVNLFANTLQKREEDFLSDVEEFTTDNIINKYTVLRDQISSVPGLPGSQPQKTLVKEEDVVLRELKNMNRQQKVNADELMAQVGRVVEAVQALTQALQKEGPQPPDKDLPAVLQALGKILENQTGLVEKMDSVSAHLQKNVDVMDRLPAAIEEMGETSKKLGELFSKIYNRSFL